MRNDRARRGTPAQVVLGMVVIGLGILFLLDNLGIFDVRFAFHFWPVVLIAAGFVKLFDTRSSDGRFLGIALIVVGTLMTFNRLGFWYFGWHTLWPLLLIVLGGSVVYKAVTSRKAIDSAMPLTDRPEAAWDAKPGQDNGSDSVVDATAILGGFERRITTRNFRGGEVTAIMGGCALDLRDSSIEGGEAVLNVFALFGGITLKVPTDWTVVLHGTPIMGGFDEKTVAPPNSAKRLIVKGHAIMGGVEVRN